MEQMDIHILRLVIEGLSYLMLLLALSITTARAVPRMITLYRWQSFALAIVTLAIGIERMLFGSRPGALGITPFMLIPILLAIAIEPLLALSTVTEEAPLKARLWRVFDFRASAEISRKAVPTWLKPRQTGRKAPAAVILDVLLVFLAYIIAFRLVSDEFQARLMAIAISLLLIGLAAMTNKQDIIAQIMGLLVMEHGMFLAALAAVITSSTPVVFIISLFLYILVTLTILAFLLPELHRVSNSIEVDDQNQLKG